MAELQSSLLLRKQLNGIRIIFNFYHILHFSQFSYILDLKKNPVEGFSAGLCDDSDIYNWEVLIIGPPDTL